MSSTSSKAVSPAYQTPVLLEMSPVTGTPLPTRTTLSENRIPGQQAEDSAEGSVLAGFLKADSPTALTDSVYVMLGHGRYQLFVACSFVLSGYMMMTHTLAYQLIGRPVGHWCRPPGNLRYLTPDAWRNAAMPLLPDGTFSGCTAYDPPAEVEGTERREVFCHEWDYGDGGYHDSIVSKWDLVCHRQWLYPFSLFLYMLGPVFSAPVAGVLGDRFGRRPIIIALLWTFFSASMVSAIANSFLMFVTARIFISATSTASSALLFILVYEVTGNEHRAIHAFVSTAVILTLSPSVLNAISSLEPSWFLAQIFLVTPTIVLAVSSSLIQESPIWLLVTGKTHQAEQNILRTARINCVDLVKAKAMFTALKAQRKTHEERALSPKASARSAYFSGGSALSVALAWFTLTLMLYVLFFPTGPKPLLEVGTNLVLETLFYAGICWYMRSKGYRHALWLSLILLCVFLALFAVFKFEDYPRFIAPLRMLAQQATHSAVTVNYCYTTEAFPAAVRAKGFFLSVFIGRLGGLLATLAPLKSGRTTAILVHMALALLVLLTAVGVQWLPEVVFFKKEKKNLAAAPEVLNEKQRKEMIKASLSPAKKSSKARTKTPRPHRDKPKETSLKHDSPSVIKIRPVKHAESLQS